jgi:hypothetical protein
VTPVLLAGSSRYRAKPVSGGKKAVEAGFEVHLARDGISIEMNKVRWYHGFLFVLSIV